MPEKKRNTRRSGSLGCFLSLSGFRKNRSKKLEKKRIGYYRMDIEILETRESFHVFARTAVRFEYFFGELQWVFVTILVHFFIFPNLLFS